MIPWFCCCYRVSWKLLSWMLMYIICWNRVVSYHFNMLNPFIKLFWLWEWKFFKSHYISQNGTMVLLLTKLLRNYFNFHVWLWITQKIVSYIFNLYNTLIKTWKLLKWIFILYFIVESWYFVVTKLLRNNFLCVHI